MKKIPMRMCVACRTMKPKNDLFRVVLDNDKITIDKTGKKSGRGAYICKDKKCFSDCLKKHSLERTFEIKSIDESFIAIVTKELNDIENKKNEKNENE